MASKQLESVSGAVRQVNQKGNGIKVAGFDEWRLGHAIGPIADAIATRFWTYVDQTDACWRWRGGHLKNGYGSFKLASYTMRLAHRVAYAIAFGSVPAGVKVLHHCDNPPCVRPDHLFLGTAADNHADMIAKKRHPAWTRPETFRRGERHPNARFTWIQICQIRQRHATGAASITSLAAEFDVTRAAIRGIVTRRTWRFPR